MEKPLIRDKQKGEIRPFFIIGSGRSGTTLLRKMLTGNPRIIIPPESGGLLELSIKFYIKKNNLPWECLVDQILKIWSKAPELDYWQINVNDITQQLKDTVLEDRSLATIIDRIYNLYRLKAKHQATIWGDKTPYATFGLKWINLLFPEARFIHMLRDGRDVVNSMLKHQLHDNIVDACDRWNQSLNEICKLSSQLNIITIRYEEFIHEPERFLRQISANLNVNYIVDQSIIDNFNFGDHLLSHHGNLIGPIIKTQIGKWKQELATETIIQVDSLLKSNLKKFHYL